MSKPVTSRSRLTSSSVDNYGTHKTPAIRRWLLRHPRFQPPCAATSELNNRDPKPFVWTKTADQILDSVAQFCKHISNSVNVESCLVANNNTDGIVVNEASGIIRVSNSPVGSERERRLRADPGIATRGSWLAGARPPTTAHPGSPSRRAGRAAGADARKRACGARQDCGAWGFKPGIQFLCVQAG